MTPVYFWQRPFHRERQRDTVAHLPPGYTAVVPPEPPSLPDYMVNIAGRATVRGRVAAGVRHLPVAVNAGVVRDPAARRCRLLYTWGKIPLLPRRPPFAVELDNPYVLSLYHNPSALLRVRPLLRRALLSQRCAGLVCISDACRRSTAATLGQDVAASARVVYPFVDDAPQATPGEHADRLELLFVGTQFALKGGHALCAAFAEVAREVPGLRLTVISRTPDEVKREYAGAPIVFVDASLPKREVLERYVARADLFVLPTMQESFGLAVLEAVAAGLPVVTTRVYALPELVREGENGLLLDDPLGMWHGPFANTSLWRLGDLERHVAGRAFPALQAQLGAALRTLVSDRPRIRAMAARSRALFDREFAPAPRAQSMARALDTFVGEPA